MCSLESTGRQAVSPLHSLLVDCCRTDSDRALLYYSPPRIDLLTPTQLEPEVLERVHNSLTEAVFDAAQKCLPSSLLPQTQTIPGIQQPAHGLLVAAEESKADLVVVGARGASSARHYRYRQCYAACGSLHSIARADRAIDC